MNLALAHVENLKDHWWWRPGWRPGRHFHACHLTFEEHPALHRLVAGYQQALAGIEGLDPIPRRWLHLTTQGIGFVDDIDRPSLARAMEAVRRRLAEVPPPVVTFHRPVVRTEAVYLPAWPADPIGELRAAVWDGLVEAFGPDRLSDQAPPPRAGPGPRFRPHVSIAYANTDQPAAPVVEALHRVDPAPVTVTIGRISLLEFHRDHRMYEWTTAEPLTIGAASPGGPG